MKQNQKGLVIIAVLWICALIMWLALQTSANIRLRNEEEIQQFRRSQALYCAMSGTYEVLAHMGESAPLDADAEESWLPDGKVKTLDLDRCRVAVVIQDETTKVNLNQADPVQLKAVLERAGVDTEESDALADRIADFLDPDDLPRLEGAEADSYEDQGVGYPPFDGPLQSLDQMVLIPGISSELFWGARTKAGNWEGPEAGSDWPASFPARDSLFDLLTVYGNNVLLDSDESGEDLEAGDETEIVPWTSGKVYRILAAGKTDASETRVVLWVIVRYTPGARKGYQVLYRKVL